MAKSLACAAPNPSFSSSHKLQIVRERNREKHLLCALGSTVPQKFIGVSYIKVNRLIYISYISLQYCPFKGGLKSRDRNW